MLLTSATQKIVAVLTSAKTTYDLPIAVNYADTVNAPFSFVGAPLYVYTNGITTVDLVVGVAGTQRSVKKLTAYGRDTAAKTIRIGIIDFTTPIAAGAFVVGCPYQITSAGTTDFTLIGAANNTPGTIFNATGVGTGTGTASYFYQEINTTLQVGDMLGYTDTQGWYTQDTNGNRKTIAGATFDMAIAIHTATNKTTPVDADEIGIWDSVTTLLNKVTWANVNTTLKTYFNTLYAALAGATFTGLVNFKTGANIASAATLDLSTATGNTVHITGTVATSAITMNAGQWVECIADGAWPLTYHATNNNLNGGASYTCSAGDRIFYFYDGTTVYGNIIKQDGTSFGTASTKLPVITATVAANALTIGMSAMALDFRSATLGSGAITTLQAAPANLVISAGSTLGTVSAVQSRLAVLAINNAGTVELAVVNIAGGNDLSETGIISTTAEGGAGAADSANVVYSTTARTNVAYRVRGYIESTQATAGTWATAPSTIQGAGGNAVTAMSSLGYGQTWQLIARVFGTTYYNTTGKPIFLINKHTNGSQGFGILTLNGLALHGYGGLSGTYCGVSALIPPTASYVLSVNTGTAVGPETYELR